MKLAYYAVVSVGSVETVLTLKGSAASAAGVVIYAFNQRANFYSACVYLAQSNLCVMVLVNLVLFLFGSFMFGLQRLFYGPLRPIEIEQLYEKAWLSVLETCLAMTMFRDEVGAWFLVMFVALLTGKVWGWIAEGRVEVLEQQPPANPRLFHIRLSLSLAISLLFDAWILPYTLNTVIDQARPNMMVMFLFEFAILTLSSWSTGLRYGISLLEANIIKNQTAERLEERRREIRVERAEIYRRRGEAAQNPGADVSDIPALPSEDDIDEMDLEVPGWEAKGHWILTLELVTDFMKLSIYLAFFIVILVFYGLPVHIIRDLFLTARSFVKRLTAFLRYRRATYLMNERYQDATAEDLAREDTCIVCREEMRPWGGNTINRADARTPQNPSERIRPKKLPCGHILHLGCLKSWLERQQVCPTCRAPVVASPTQPPQHQPPPQGGNPPPPAPGARPNGGGVRMLNLGPLRVGFGQPQDILQQMNAAQAPRRNATPAPQPRANDANEQQRQQPPLVTNIGAPQLPWSAQLSQIEAQILQDIRNLQVAQSELHTVSLLQAELARLRSLSAGTGTNLSAGARPNLPPMPPAQLPPYSFQPFQTPALQRHGPASGASAIPAGSADLPPGVTIPEGWSLLPLQRIDGLAPNMGLGLNLPPQPAVPTAEVPSHPPAAPPAPSLEIPRAAPSPAHPQTRPQTPELRGAPQDHSESIARLEEQRNMIHQLPEETRSLAERLINAETNALRQRASAESLTSRAGHAANEARASRPASPVPPAWGSSQFFPGYRPAMNAMNIPPPPAFAGPSPPPPPPASQPASSSRDTEASSASSSQPEHTEDADRGKTRAVTVEDVSDDDTQ